MTDETRAEMRKILSDIQTGAYAEEWMDENATGRPIFNQLREDEMDSQVEQVGRDLRRMMPWLNPKEVKPGRGRRIIASDSETDAGFGTVVNLLNSLSLRRVRGGRMADIVRIFDTTLRDGEQSPGATLNIDEKLEIARQLARLGVDIIEAGFPIASPGDFEAVRRIAEEIGTAENAPTIAGLARAAQGRHRPGLGGGAARLASRASTPSWRPPTSTWSTSSGSAARSA